MNPFLNQFIETLPETQKRKLKELLYSQYEKRKLQSEYELQRELEYLLDQLESRKGKPIFQNRRQSKKLNAESYNQNLEEIFLDLTTLFEASAITDKLLTNHHQLSKSLLMQLQKEIHMLQEKVKVYQILQQQNAHQINHVFENFISPEWIETRESQLSLFRKERGGYSFSSQYNAEYQGGALRLAGVQTQDQIKTNYGRKLANIRVRHRLGDAETYKEHPIDHAIDGSQETFWVEKVKTKKPLVQDMNEEWSKDYSFYPKDGAICEIEIDLNGLTTVSDIVIDPYGYYPMEIVSIFGHKDSTNNHVYPLVTPNHSNANQRSKKSVKRMHFQFPSKDVTKLRILIRQENYTIENIINDDEEDLWNALFHITKEKDDKKEIKETIAAFNRKHEIPEWEVYVEKISTWLKDHKKPNVLDWIHTIAKEIKTNDNHNALISLIQSFGVKKQDSTSSTKKAASFFSYVYGIQNLRIFGKTYKNTSVYISKPLPLSSNTQYITLETKENHHDINIGPEQYYLSKGEKTDKHLARITDIEYYMTNQKQPSSSDWIPILPINKKEIKGERLIGDYLKEEDQAFKNQSLMIYSLRFPAVSKSQILLRRDGIPMSSNMFIVSDNHQRIGIKQAYYSASAIYTVDYQPNQEAYQGKVQLQNTKPVQFLNENGETGEYFSHPDENNQVTLKHMPYLSREHIYQYYEQTNEYQQNNQMLKASSIHFPIIVHVKGKEFKNITDYTHYTYDPERLKENNGETFAHIGNQIIFGTPVHHPLEEITVDYHYIATDIRIKAILRRNHAGYESLTPALYHYHIQGKTYDQMR